jgi:hypothetical protein
VSAAAGSTIAGTSEPSSYHLGLGLDLKLELDLGHHLKSWGSSARTGCHCSPPPVGCFGSLNYYYYSNYCPSYCFLAVNSEEVLNISSIEVLEVVRFASPHCSTEFCFMTFQPIHGTHLACFDCFVRC